MIKEIKMIVSPPPKHWVGNGFYVHSMFHPKLDIYKYTTPFLLMDFAPSKKFAASENKRGVGEHPHKGFETVTIAYEGEVEHRDSSGGGGVISQGGVQWMTAGSGVVHEEFHSKEFTKKGGLFEMVQLWVNLPNKDKEASAKYQALNKEDIPTVDVSQGVKVGVVSGSFNTQKSSINTFSPITILNLSLEEGAEFDIDAEDETLLILNRKGSVVINNRSLNEHELAIFERKGSSVKIVSGKKSELLILKSRPIDEEYFSYGPFVLSNKEEVVQAYEDYRNGLMGHLD